LTECVRHVQAVGGEVPADRILQLGPEAVREIVPGNRPVGKIDFHLAHGDPVHESGYEGTRIAIRLDGICEVGKLPCELDLEDLRWPKLVHLSGIRYRQLGIP
jgi:hypothetical protein